MAPDQKGHKPKDMSDKAYRDLHKFCARMNLKYQNQNKKKDKPA